MSAIAGFSSFLGAGGEEISASGGGCAVIGVFTGATPDSAGAAVLRSAFGMVTGAVDSCSVALGSTTELGALLDALEADENVPSSADATCAVSEGLEASEDVIPGAVLRMSISGKTNAVAGVSTWVLSFGVASGVATTMGLSSAAAICAVSEGLEGSLTGTFVSAAAAAGAAVAVSLAGGSDGVSTTGGVLGMGPANINFAMVSLDCKVEPLNLAVDRLNNS